MMWRRTNSAFTCVPCDAKNLLRRRRTSYENDSSQRTTEKPGRHSQLVPERTHSHCSGGQALCGARRHPGLRRGGLATGDVTGFLAPDPPTAGGRGFAPACGGGGAAEIPPQEVGRATL